MNPTDSPASQPELPEVGGVSHTEFTQLSPRQVEPPRYAIPAADPAEATIAVSAVSPERSSRAERVPEHLTAPQLPSYPAAQAIPAPAKTYAAPREANPHPARRPNRIWLWGFLGAAFVVISTSVALSAGAFLVIGSPAIRAAALPTNAPNGTLMPTLMAAAAADESLGALLVQTLSAPPNAATMVAVPPLTRASPTAAPTLGVNIQPWDGQNRLAILMMGLDKRPRDPGTAFRTDSMILISIDPATRKVGMLSIPRDLFVDIPADTVVRNAYGLQRINAAYVIGELARPGYGASLAVQTVQYNLGVRINHYVVYEFGTVIQGIDAIGGVEINVPKPIYDGTYPDMYYGYDPLRIPAGNIRMNGELALKYARSRHTTSDFDRAKRQQQVILAARDKIARPDTFPGLVARAPQLWNQLSTTTKTDLSFEQLLRLGVYLKDIPASNITQGVLEGAYVTGVNYNGASVLVPERARIGALLKEVFGENYN